MPYLLFAEDKEGDRGEDEEGGAGAAAKKKAHREKASAEELAAAIDIFYPRLPLISNSNLIVFIPGLLRCETKIKMTQGRGAGGQQFGVGRKDGIMGDRNRLKLGNSAGFLEGEHSGRGG